jgi:hypothetical protein
MAKAMVVCFSFLDIVCSSLLVKAGTSAGAYKGGTVFALSFAGIIQIRYGGYLSPGTAFQDP